MCFFKNESVKSEFTAKALQSAAQKLALVKMDDAEPNSYDRYMMKLSYEIDGLTEGKVRGEAKRIIAMPNKGRTL